MSKTIRSVLNASGIVLAVSVLGSPVFAEEKAGQDFIEARQETQIWTTYVLSPYLRASDLKVSVHNGKATLTGKVNEDVNKELAQQIALGVSGIKDVDNQIQVDEAYVPPKVASVKSYGEMVDDASISAAVKSKLVWSKHTDAMNIRVETKQGQVTLSGKADSEDAKAIAGKLAMSTRGVTAVDNRLAISEVKPSATDSMKMAANKAEQSISDSWITTKVKSTFMYSSNVDSKDISVNTQNGVVTLSGKLGSGAEQALAIELAQNVKGVKEVQSKNLKF